MPCVFCYSKQEVLPFSPDPPVMPAVLADRDAPCHHLVAPGRRTLSLPLRLLRPNHRQKQQLERPIHQPISSHHAKLWRVARRSRTSSTRTSRLRQRGHFMQSTPFLLWICTHYTACTPLLQSLFRHFVLRALNVSKSRPFHAIGMGRRLSSEMQGRYIRIRSWIYFWG